jgi:hypothetical protein
VSADLVVLVFARPRIDDVIRGIAAPHDWVRREGADIAAAQLAQCLVWFAAAWLALALIGALASAVPGAIGSVAARLSALLLPAAMRRAVAGLIGVSVALAPTAASAAAVASMPGTIVATRPVPIPSPSLPIQAVPIDLAPPVLPNDPHLPLPIPRPERDARAVVVRGGDSLWRIAEQALGATATPAQVATAWPAWYAANRAEIGADPDVLHTGQQLIAPRPAPGSAGMQR